MLFRSTTKNVVAGIHDPGHPPSSADEKKSSADLLALLVYCAAATPGAANETLTPDAPLPPARELGVPIALPAMTQPAAHLLSALTPTQKAATFRGNVQVAIRGHLLTVTSDGLPTHATDAFPTSEHPHRSARQSYHFRLPLAPKFAAKPVPLPFGPIGVAIDGVPFYHPYHRAGRDAVLGVNAPIFDSDCGHADALGRFHYAKFPTGPRAPFAETPGEHSALVGWAFDGFPIYGPQDEAGAPPADLDECHGHADPARGYHYHAAPKFPYLLGAYRGVVEMSNFPGPQVWGVAPR